MDDRTLRDLLEAVNGGKIKVEEALSRLRHFPYEDISIALVDHHRSLRQGIPEVVFGKDKKPEDVVSIARTVYKRSKRLMITKASAEIHRKLRIRGSTHHAASGLITAGGEKTKRGLVLVICAGTSDIPVAEEAAVTAEFLGSRTATIYDAGVAGMHRLFSRKKEIEKARVIIVVAGMEGALPSVVGGMTDKPVVAVPTSVGYGTSLGGLTALFAMLNSCVPGIAVMNIDNGFGAGCMAHRINTLPAARPPGSGPE